MDTQQSTYQHVCKVLIDLFEIEPDDIHPEADLFTDLDIDSIDAVDLMLELKRLTGKKMQPEDFKRVRTVQDVVEEVDKLLKEQ